MKGLILALVLALVGCAKKPSELAESIILVDTAEQSSDPAFRKALDLAERSGLGDRYYEEIKGLVAAKKKMLDLDAKQKAKVEREQEEKIQREIQRSREEGRAINAEAQKSVEVLIRSMHTEKYFPQEDPETKKEYNRRLNNIFAINREIQRSLEKKDLFFSLEYGLEKKSDLASRKEADDLIKSFLKKNEDERIAREKAESEKKEKERAEAALKEKNRKERTLWEWSLSPKMYVFPAIGADGSVYVGSLDGKVYALDGKTGTKKWEFVTRGAVASPPVIGADGTVYFASNDKTVYALDGKTGDRKWEYKTETIVQHSPAIGVDGTVYILFKPQGGGALPVPGATSSSPKLHALDGKTGTKKWEFQTGYGVAETSSPAIGVDGNLYIGPHAFYGAVGAKKWVFFEKNTVGLGGVITGFPGQRATAPSLSAWTTTAIGDEGTVYFGTKNGKIYALNGITGSKKWEFLTGGPISSSPSIGTDGTVYIGSEDKKFYALNGKTGAKIWEFESEDNVRSSPAIGSDGTIYIGSDDKKVYALDGKTGVKKWEFETKGFVYPPAILIGSDGTLYVAASEILFALKSESTGLADSAWPMHGQNPQHTSRIFSAKAPVVPPIAKAYPWTAGVNQNSLDRYYAGKSAEQIKKGFGKPDNIQGDWWNYTGMNITGLPGQRFTGVWFHLVDDVVKRVRFDFDE